MGDASKVCAGVPEAYRDHAVELVEQLDFMRDKLEESRKAMEGMALVYTTKNTQGDVVPKRNPAFEEYGNLMRTFLRSLDELRDILGKQAATQPKMLKFEKYAQTMRKTAQ